MKIIPDRIKKGDTIGIVCPSHIPDRERHIKSEKTLNSLGFKVKFGDNVYKTTYGYLASETERADDFNIMISDSDIKMIIFGGGEGGNEVIPYLDYDNIVRNPKIFCSFSDGTSVLNTIHAMTGLVVYYGQAPGMFNDLRDYDYVNFNAHLIEGNSDSFIKNGDWQVLNGGICEGKLIGGYLRNFTLLFSSNYFKYDVDEKYLVFLEDHKDFSSVAKVSSFISHIEHGKFIDNIAGLIFGHYSENVPVELLQRLERFGKKYDIPVVYTDDFGHGTNHAIFPIGVNAVLDTENKSLEFIK